MEIVEKENVLEEEAEKIPPTHEEAISDFEEAMNIPDPPPMITPSRRNPRLSKKRGGQEYQEGEVATLASERKALRVNFDTCIGGDGGTETHDPPQV